MAFKAIIGKYINIVSAGEKLAGLTKDFLQLVTNSVLNLNNIDDKLIKSAHQSCGSCFHFQDMQSESPSQNSMGKSCSKTLFYGSCRVKKEDIREEYFRLMAAGISEATNTDRGILEPPAIEITEFPPGSIDQLQKCYVFDSKLQNMDLKLLSCEKFYALTNTGPVEIAGQYFLYARFVYAKESIGLNRLSKKERNIFLKILEKKDLLEKMVFEIRKEYKADLTIEDFRENVMSLVKKLQADPKSTGDISHIKHETFGQKPVTVSRAGVATQVAENETVESVESLDGMGTVPNTLTIANIDKVSNHTAVNTSFDDNTTPSNQNQSKFGFRRLITFKENFVARSKMQTRNLVKSFGKLKINSPKEEEKNQKKDNEATLKESVRSASCEREIQSRKKRTPFRRSKKLPGDAVSTPPDTNNLLKVKPMTENSGVDDKKTASSSHPPPLTLPPPSGPGVSVCQDKAALCQSSASSSQAMKKIPTECSKQVIEEMKQMVSKIRTDSFVNGSTVTDIELKTLSKTEEQWPTRPYISKCQKQSGQRLSKIPLLVGSESKLQTHIKPEVRDKSSESTRVKPATKTPIKTASQAQLPIDPKFKLVSQKQNKPDNSISNPEIPYLCMKSKVGNHLEKMLESPKPFSQTITDTQSQMSTPGEAAVVIESKILEPKSPQPAMPTGTEQKSPCKSQKPAKTEESKTNASDGSPMNTKSNGAAKTVSGHTPPKLQENEPVRYLSRKQRRLLEAEKSPDTRPSRHAQDPQTPPHRLISIQALESPDKNSVDVTAHLQTNATVDYSSYTIEPQHGSRPNKKKLKEKIKQKTKTRGTANKHLRRHDGANDHIVDDFDSTADKSFDIEVSDDEAEQQQQEQHLMQQEQEQSFEHAQEEEIISAVDQVPLLDDREYNMVAQEVLRKEDDRLRDLEEQYSVCGKNKEKDKKKRKEKKHKRQVLPLV